MPIRPCQKKRCHEGSSNATGDELALLSFKSMMSSPSEGLLASWNKSSHFCSWAGVVCGRRHPNRVVSLQLGSSNLSGRISPFLGNLSFLKMVDLGNNHLVGQIPLELGRLSKLQELNLSTNSLQGSIPVAIGGCTNLMVLDLSSNHLQGEIPTVIGTSLKNLVHLYLKKNILSGEIPQSLAELSSIQFLLLSYNNLYGEIPSALSNLTNLFNLDLSRNMLSGGIPSSLGMLPNLSVLSLGLNNLTGPIPTSIWNISSLGVLSVQRNMLSGTIPPNALYTLPNLQRLYMDHNHFHGHIPSSLANASNLSIIVLGANRFSGIIPQEVGRLRNLNQLVLTDTLVEAKEPKDWEFMTSLANCSQLEALVLATCEFSGFLPDSLSSLSTSLKYLSLSQNAISGSIPKDIGNLFNLQVLDLAYNSFTGSLPSSLSRLKNLRDFFGNDNNISGSIPLAIGNLTELISLYLGSNAFSGRLPNTLANLTKLLELYLSNNNFVGPIPSGLFNISTLSIDLDLSYNSLEASIPQEIGNLVSLVEFHAESNKLSGEIPASLGECQGLRYLYLQNNILNGNIAEHLSQMKSLQILDLSSNNLSGPIPKFLGNLTMLSFLNLSFNNFMGEVPTFGVFANSTAISIQGNGKLCGGIPDLHLPPCPLQLPKNKHKLLVIPIVISLVGTLIVLALLYKLLTWYKRNKTKIPSTTSMQGHPLISYSQLVKATDGFSAKYLLGSGSFGSVYKGELDGQVGESTNLVAVKVLKLQTPGAVKSFVAECEALRNLRHRNLVKIITACLSIDNNGNDFKAIVYDFMPNGSLEGWLHPDANGQTERKFLNLLERVSILLDVAFALDYLHCNGPAPVIHCDLKSSNVLLDADMVAHVGDFGLAKILFEKSSVLQQSMSSMGVRGTIGYAAPEYGAGNMVSTHGDIYSYGILVLETVTGKRPTDSEFPQGLSLREYVEVGLHGRVLDVVDTQLSSCLENELQSADKFSCKTKIDCLISLLRLGVSCSHEMPSNRLPAGDIINELRDIKESLM
ncbi:receptor kinase-like protein Xa21 isoform X2 [Phragmites australis]|uniref:receptor kinase-like protein Xa21 isoform X2 n=1 Tax=Phragmites australis TaxID=29695 RepID=UPI002D78CC7D|nr:receptor kinase-like protein Xa21 isoform X2 [Phragmites australis]XP_062197183.1 receptor kinase-like protein Xa21 isoform X2 [Phragmites australis]